MQFGRSSEKLDRQIEQLELRLEELQARTMRKKVAALPEQHSRCTCSSAPSAAAVARALAAGSAKYLPKQEACPDCGGAAEASRRRCFGDPGIRAGPLQSDPPGSSQAGLRGLRTHRASGSAEPADRARHRWSGTSGACAGVEILATTCRCIASRRFMRGKAWSWIARRWRTGWAERASCWRRWWKRCDVT